MNSYCHCITLVLHRPIEPGQYAALDFTNRLEDLGLFPSYSSFGDALDNAGMETFWATPKRELLWTTGISRFETRAAVRTALFD